MSVCVYTCRLTCLIRLRFDYTESKILDKQIILSIWRVARGKEHEGDKQDLKCPFLDLPADITS